MNNPQPQQTLLEAERQQIAALIENEIVGSLDLLITKSGYYGELHAAEGNEGARLTAAVLHTLAQDVMVRVRSVQNTLVCPEDQNPGLLSARESEVLQYLAQGLSNKAIAEQMQVSPHTVNFHLNNIYSKLNVNNRTEALLSAMRSNLLK